MSISIGTDLSYQLASDTAKVSRTAEELEKKLQGNTKDGTDEELMGVCKQFESYLLEQVFKEMERTIPKAEEKENPYNEYFGDMLYEQYSNSMVESGELGIAQMLYDSMKRS